MSMRSRDTCLEDHVTPYCREAEQNTNLNVKSGPQLLGKIGASGHILLCDYRCATLWLRQIKVSSKNNCLAAQDPT